MIDFQEFQSSTRFHQTRSFMEKMMITKRKPKELSKSNDDDEEVMTLVKGAAWAWFHHGSGSKGESFQPFRLTRSEKLVVPSRFKLEARRVVMEINNNDSSSESSSSEYVSLTLSPAQTDNSLLDAYEIEQISRQLDILIETRRRRSSFTSDLDQKKNLPLPPPPPPRTSPGSEKKVRKNPKKLNESWLLRYGAVCSSIEGVVEPRSLGAVCSSIEGVVEPRLLNRSGQRKQGPSDHQRKAHYK